MPDETLLSYSLLSIPTFVRDLRHFVSLPAEILQHISDLADDSEGFSGHHQAQTLNEHYGIRLDAAIRHLRLAEHLYHRVNEHGIEVGDALEEIVATVRELEDPVDVDDAQRAAIQSLLSYKRQYELSQAVDRAATDDGPHFVKLGADWVIKPITVGGTEIVKAPVLTMSLSWHDGLDNGHEAYFQLTDKEWQVFKAKMDSVAERREEIDGMLK